MNLRSRIVIVAGALCLLAGCDDCCNSSNDIPVPSRLDLDSLALRIDDRVASEFAAHFGEMKRGRSWMERKDGDFFFILYYTPKNTDVRDFHVVGRFDLNRKRLTIERMQQS